MQSNRLEKARAAAEIFLADSPVSQKLSSLRKLTSGLDSRLDEKLETCQKALGDLEKLFDGRFWEVIAQKLPETTEGQMRTKQKLVAWAETWGRLNRGELAELTGQSLPEETEEDKKKKKAFLWFLKNWKDLNSEIARVNTELQSNQNGSSSTTSFGKIVALAKGPLGLMTVAAVIVVIGVAVWRGSQKPNAVNNPAATPAPQATPTKNKAQFIIYQGKQIPVSQLRVGTGSDCDAPHYHALNEISVTALNGAVIPDPGGCGYGRISQTPVQQL